MLAGLGRLTRLCGVMLGAMAVVLAVQASAATNIISASAVSSKTFPITANDVKPPECAALNLTGVTIGSGKFSSGNGPSLVIGGNGADTIRGGNGPDCIVGGSGNDALDGNNGDDVLLGGPGDDNIDGGPGNDICYGGPGNDTFIHCEIVIQ